MRSRSIFLVLLFIAAFSYVRNVVVASRQEETTQRPVLAGRPVGGSLLTFHILGSGSTWEVPLPDSSHTLHSWSPDGCNMLLRGSNGWKILSVIDGGITEIPRSSPVSELSAVIGQTWSFDGEAITFSILVSNNDTRIYSVDVNELTVEPILSLTERGRALQWFSETELLYETEEGYFVWDTIDMESRLHRKSLNIPSGWSSEVYPSYESPNRGQVARFYSLNAYSSIVSGESEPDSTAYLEAIEAIPQIPGFDIYFLKEGVSEHIDMMGQFLQSLAWSPSGNHIVVSTDPISTPDDVNGIYVYDVNNESLQRVSDFPAMYNAEYGPYIPTWSADGNWLAFPTPADSYIAYHLESNRMINLPEEFTSSYMSLLWSPIMDYTNSKCSADVEP